MIEALRIVFYVFVFKSSDKQFFKTHFFKKKIMSEKTFTRGVFRLF